MMLEIPDLLDATTLSAIREIASRDDLFVDGTGTAGWHARERKRNLQAKPSGLVTGVLKKVEQLLLQHDLVQVAARPRNLVRIMLSRYDAGMSYGTHVDDAFIDGQRTDLSFTLFITPPDSYTGGELILDEAAGERHIKLNAGHLFLYPSSSLHRVAPVIQGTRLVIVGWLRSLVRDPQQREMLFDLDRAIFNLREDSGIDRRDSQAEETLALLLKTRSNLLRLWAED